MKERGYLSGAGTLYPVDGSIFIGSRDCEVAVKDAAPRHVQIARTSDGHVAVDMTGQKLMRVNGARTDRRVLREGDVVAVGSAEFRWTVLLEPEEEAVAEPVRRPTPRRERPAVKPKSRLPLIVAASVAAVAVLVLIVLLSSSKPSNREPAVVRREVRPPAPVESRTPSPVAVPVVVVRPTAAAIPEPRRDPGGVPVVVETPPPPLVPPALPEPEPAPLPPKYTSPYAARYLAVIRSLEQALAKGTGLEAAHRELLQASSSAPGEASSLLRALAASLKAAVTCGDCAGGRVTCGPCDGKGRVDLDCSVCQGKGRVRPLGVVGNADVSVKCRNCDGKRIFRGVTCPSCSRSGKIVCPACKGQVWPGDRCPRPECRSGRVACPNCAGLGQQVLPCPGGCIRGRVRAPGAVGDADVTQKCRDCEVNGAHGNGTVRVECKLCQRTGKVTCDACGGPFAKRVEVARASIPSSKVFTSEPCEECERCFGSGLRIQPVGGDR